MYQEQIQLLFDYIKGLNCLLEFDTQSLEQTRDKQNYIPKTISYYPKDKFINYITSELTEKLQVQSNQIKEYCKLQNENLLHKIKSQEAIIQKLQQQIDEKPNHEDIYEIHVDLRTIQQTFTNEIQNLEKSQENRLNCLNSNLKEYVAINEFEGLFESHIGDYISRLQSRFAPKELTISKLNTFDCQMNHITEQLLELKKFANTNISQLINKQNVILSDLTTTVKHHEYSQLVQVTEQCITQTQLNQFQNEILPKIEGLQNNQKDNQQSIDEFRQIIKRTDYDLLQKATKMDWQIQKKQNEEIQIQNQFLQVQLQNQTKEIQGFYQFYENQKQIMGNDLSQQIIENINTVICEQVQKSMESYNLADVSQQIERLKDFLKQKANKNDIIDALNLKSNRLDFSGLETKVNNALKLFKSQMSIVSEFMELFGSETDIESMNFKKNTIQKLIFDTNSLQGNFMKLCQTQSNFKQEGEQPQTARGSSTFRQKFNTSPKNTGVRLFLRPLLSNTQSVQQTKRNKLNSSMYEKNKLNNMNDDKLIIKITTYSSMFAGIIGKIVCHPIDTIRAKIQIRQTMMLKIKADKLISQMFKETIQNEGIRGLYKGLGITIIGTGPAYSLYLTTYETSKYLLNNQHQYFKDSPNLVSFASGMMAETVSCLLWLPIDVIKERLQVQSNLKVFDYKNTLDAVGKILKSEGIVGLYRAYGATVASYGPFSAFYFMFYEKLKTFLDNPLQPSFSESLILSGMAGCLAGFICNPMDIVRLRMQVQRASKATHQAAGNFGYKNLIHGMYQVVRNEGPLSLTKGAMAKMLYTCPNTAISMSVAEVTRSYFLKKHQN